MTDRQEPAAAPQAASGQAESGWERDLIGELARETLREQRRARRWGIFFKLAFMVYLLVLLLLYLPSGLFSGGDSDERHTALIDIEGIITAGADASADIIAGGLRAAFEHEQTAAVILRINSPGGSPVQAAYINDEIQRLRARHPDTPVYAVISDLCASGGYYVAVAAERIYASESSLVGSIGVLMNGFGFVDTMDLLGVERRLYTAGEHKGFLDPFSPERAEEVAHIRRTLEQLHEEFIEVVREGRGERLGDSEELFSGLIWSGRESKALGLIDDFGSAGSVARDVVGVERIVDFTPRIGVVERLVERLGASMGRQLSSALGLQGPQLR